MSAVAPDGSIARRDTARPDLLAFEIRGKITKPDIEWMSGVVDGAIDAHDEIDMLIVMTNYDGSELGAIFDGKAMLVQTKSVAHVRRYGVVGAPAFARAMIEVFGAIGPVETETFDLAEERDAWTWIDGDATTRKSA